MIDSMYFTNVNGVSLTLNDTTPIYPVKVFTSQVDARFTERVKSQQHGIYQAATYWGKRTIHMEGDVIGQNAADFVGKRNALMGAFMPRPQLGVKKAGTLFVQWTGMSEPTQIDVTLDSYPQCDLGGMSPALAPFQLNLKAFDPRYYGALQTGTLLYGINDNIGGRAYNKTYNKTYSTVGTGTTSSYVTNGGSVETYPVVTFYGPVSDPRITLIRSDGVVLYFTLTGLTLSSTSDYAVVDMANHTVTRFDGSNLYNYSVGSDWFAIEPLPYTSLLRFTGSSGSSPSYAQIQWRNAYMM